VREHRRFGQRARDARMRRARRRPAPRRPPYAPRDCRRTERRGLC